MILTFPYGTYLSLSVSIETINGLALFVSGWETPKSYEEVGVPWFKAHPDRFTLKIQDWKKLTRKHAHPELIGRYQ
jgi:hypothetical protein